MQQFIQGLLSREAAGRKGNFRKVLSFLMFLTFLPMLAPSAWSSATQGDLTGKVVDKNSRKPVANAFVTAKGLGTTFSVTTDETGYFSFVDLEPGTYTLTIERVGYQSLTVADLPVTANSTLFETYQIQVAVYNVQGVTVSGYQSQTVNPRQTMTYYEFSKQELNELLPGPSSLQINQILDELPGVQNLQTNSPYSLSGPHIRGGTGLGTNYAIDGVPIVNSGLFNNLGNVGLTTGLSDFQFFPGDYPVQFGNGIDGYVNEIVPEGYGQIHGDLQTSFGFWLDASNNKFPIFNANGQPVGYSSQGPQLPDYFNLELSGQSDKFHYYLNFISQNGGTSGYENPNVMAPSYWSSDGYNLALFRQTTKDLALNLNYNMDPDNELEFLWMNGFSESASVFLGNTPPLTPTESMELPSSPFQELFYDLESFQFTHHFAPGNSLTFNVWSLQDNPDEFFFTAPLYYEQSDLQRDTGSRIEWKLQLNPENSLTVGGQFLYTDNGGVYAYAPPFSPIYTGVGESFLSASNSQSSSTFLNDEWTLTPKWDINVGLRWDKENYLPVSGAGPESIYTQPNGLPWAAETFTGFSPDPASLYKTCTPLFDICTGSSVFSPSLVQPRISASYRVMDDFTIKGGWGKFATFPITADEEYLSQLCAPGTGVGNPDNTTNTFCNMGATIGGKTYSYVALTTDGNKPQTGQDYDLSFEYLLNPYSFVKITPYFKSEVNPLLFTFIPTAATGGDVNATSLTAKGVEFELHTRDWHGLSGTLDYTYDNARVTGNPEYALAYLVPTFYLINGLTGKSIVQPNTLYATPQGAALYNQALSQSTPADWDIPNTANLLLDYKPDKYWDIAPNFTFESGIPYGLGSSNLLSIYSNLSVACGTCGGDIPVSGIYNPLGETTPNSLHAPSEFLANLSVTYHLSKIFSTTLTIFNLFNNSQILSYNSTPTVANTMTAVGYPFIPDYSPLKGQYAPLQIEALRQYFVTATFNF